jgi:NAD(P)-dependent dehydrogenase (short-subunit alcohol dehydrogenase family)
MKNFLITGGASYIGLCVSRHFVQKLDIINANSEVHGLHYRSYEG